MAQFIQKFESIEDYNASVHQYPNISLVEGEGLVWTAEEPEPDVLLNGSKIKWNVTDGVNRTSVDYPSISFADAQTLINALNDSKNYTVTATINYNYDDKKVWENAEVDLNVGESNFEVYALNDGKEQIWVADISLFSNTRAGYNAVLIDVNNDWYWPHAKWEINYTIDNAR